MGEVVAREKVGQQLRELLNRKNNELKLRACKQQRLTKTVHTLHDGTIDAQTTEHYLDPPVVVDDNVNVDFEDCLRHLSES